MIIYIYIYIHSVCVYIYNILYIYIYMYIYIYCIYIYTIYIYIHIYPSLLLKSCSHSQIFPETAGTFRLRSRRLGTEAAQQTLAALYQLHAVTVEATQDLERRVGWNWELLGYQFKWDWFHGDAMVTFSSGDSLGVLLRCLLGGLLV